MPKEQQIRERALRLWREAGEPQGRNEEFLRRAEQELKREDLAARLISRTLPARTGSQFRYLAKGGPHVVRRGLIFPHASPHVIDGTMAKNPEAGTRKDQG
jgi:Protein of unknown function (DUF2934)